MQVKATAELESYMTAAAGAGLPREQTRNFVLAGYVALRWALGFHASARECDRDDGPVMVACGGARGPGKSYAIMSQLGLDDCQRQPGLKALYLRKVQRSASESFDDLVRRIFSYLPHAHVEGRVTFENGSRILIGGYNSESDIDKYMGIEYDVIALEEGTQISGQKRLKMRGSLRTSKPEWRTRWYESANPGGIGHGDFKQFYIQPQRDGHETQTRFFPATYRDNPFLSSEYIAYLESLPGPLGRAWRDGDWDSFEGMAFEAWQHDRHTCEPFWIPPHWQRFTGTDEGRVKPFCNLWLAQEPDTGRVYVYREAYQIGLTSRQQAQAIRMSEGEDERIFLRLADPSMWTKKTHEAATFSSADEYAAEGVHLMRADNNRLIGKRKVDSLLADLPDGRPGMIVFRNCVNLIRTLPDLPRDPIHVEDVDTEADDHCFDALKYGLTRVNARPKLKPKGQESLDRVAKLAGLAGYAGGLGSRDL